MKSVMLALALAGALSASTYKIDITGTVTAVDYRVDQDWADTYGEAKTPPNIGDPFNMVIDTGVFDYDGGELTLFAGWPYEQDGYVPGVNEAYAYGLTVAHDFANFQIPWSHSGMRIELNEGEVVSIDFGSFRQPTGHLCT